MQSITIDRSKPLREESNTGHNRWHPDISAVLEVDEGEDVLLETRDAFDGQMRPGVTEADFAGMDAGVIHPLTGPVAVKGAAPGDPWPSREQHRETCWRSNSWTSSRSPTLSA